MIKRIFDIILSLIGIILLSPLLFAIALGIKVSSPGPIFYRGIRIGLHGKPFAIFKFRTMVASAETLGGPSTADDDTRITSFGKVLRKYKIDELPQLFNVLKGEMSLVGPRPDVKKVINLLPEREKTTILSVRPGITDYASLAFSNEGELLKGSKDAHSAYLKTIWPEKVKLQKRYIAEQSLATDMIIILKTLKRLIIP